MSLRHRIRFYQQLAVLARAGVTLRASLARLKERIGGREMAVLSKKVSAGERIGDAFIAAGFSPFECHLVSAGERSAQLETVFQHLADFWARQLEMRQALMRPLYYPIVVLHLAVIVGSLIQLATTPWPVVALHCIWNLGLLYAIGFAVIIVLRASWSSEMAQRIWLFIPILGRALSSAYSYRWITALKLEHGAGVPMPDAVADAWRASGFVGSERLAREGEQALREGAELSTLVQRWRRLPRDWIDFIETGEISGELETAFANLEAEAGRAWSQSQQQMSQWLPKIAYFIILIIAAAEVAGVIYQTSIAPIIDAESQIDNAVNGK